MILNSHPLKVHGYTELRTSDAHYMVKCDDYYKVRNAIKGGHKAVEVVGLAGEEILVMISDFNSMRRVTPVAMNLIGKTNAECNEREAAMGNDEEVEDEG